MKKITVLLSLIAVLTLSACSASQPTPRPAPAAPPATTEYIPPPTPEVNPRDDPYSTFTPRLPECAADESPRDEKGRWRCLDSEFLSAYPEDAVPDEQVRADIASHSSRWGECTVFSRMTSLMLKSDSVFLECAGEGKELTYSWKSFKGWYLASTSDGIGMYNYQWHPPETRNYDAVVPLTI